MMVGAPLSNMVVKGMEFCYQPINKRGSKEGGNLEAIYFATQDQPLLLLREPCTVAIVGS